MEFSSVLFFHFFWGGGGDVWTQINTNYVPNPATVNIRILFELSYELALYRSSPWYTPLLPPHLSNISIKPAKWPPPPSFHSSHTHTQLSKWPLSFSPTVNLLRINQRWSSLNSCRKLWSEVSFFSASPGNWKRLLAMCWCLDMQMLHPCHVFP